MVRYGGGYYFGWNSSKASPAFVHHPWRLRHAEVHAIGKLPEGVDYRRVKVYVCRQFQDGSFALAKPCKYCQKHLEALGVSPRKVFYTNEQGDWERLLSWDVT